MISSLLSAPHHEVQAREYALPAPMQTSLPRPPRMPERHVSWNQILELRYLKHSRFFPRSRQPRIHRPSAFCVAVISWMDFFKLAYFCLLLPQAAQLKFTFYFFALTTNYSRIASSKLFSCHLMPKVKKNIWNELVLNSAPLAVYVSALTTRP